MAMPPGSSHLTAIGNRGGRAWATFPLDQACQPSICHESCLHPGQTRAIIHPQAGHAFGAIRAGSALSARVKTCVRKEPARRAHEGFVLCREQSAPTQGTSEVPTQG